MAPPKLACFQPRFTQGKAPRYLTKSMLVEVHMGRHVLTSAVWEKDLGRDSVLERNNVCSVAKSSDSRIRLGHLHPKSGKGQCLDSQVAVFVQSLFLFFGVNWRSRCFSEVAPWISCQTRGGTSRVALSGRGGAGGHAHRLRQELLLPGSGGVGRRPDATWRRVGRCLWCLSCLFGFRRVEGGGFCFGRLGR